MKFEIEKLLSGGDMRSIGNSNSLNKMILNQNDFDELFNFLFHKERLLVMRASDVIEKITVSKPLFLNKHKKEIIELSNIATDKELKWHLSLLIPRLTLGSKEFGKAWETLTTWAKDKTNSRIVRVNAIQGLFEMMKQKTELEKDFSLTLSKLEKENIPSIQARIRKYKNASR